MTTFTATAFDHTDWIDTLNLRTGLIPTYAVMFRNSFGFIGVQTWTDSRAEAEAARDKLLNSPLPIKVEVEIAEVQTA